MKKAKYKIIVKLEKQLINGIALLNYIVTLVRLSLVTNKGYLLTYLLT